MVDTYQTLTELSHDHQKGKDFEILTGNEEHPDIALLAIHGGWIELGTEEIVKALAGDEFAYYIFAGRKPSDNRDLHITTTHFDDPLAQKMVKQAKISLSFHGCSDENCRSIDIGGGNDELTKKFYEHCKTKAESLGIDFTYRQVFPGEEADNIINLNTTGIQMEIPRWFREKLLQDQTLFTTLVEHLKSYLLQNLHQPSNDIQ
ncbi:MAG: poly-gamma-glutamate hydrolase family protein [Candidatus Peribacteria bacterium]|jgi:phage replication-related protein YjqB (UPF0714/DUF867 family)|nr:poly-gamma-glutamate hydrolase family protein [Candidatus Peribacteria bacterium]